MGTDPAPFLSTIITTSAALVAIVGGLLVARFVSLDSDQRGTRKVLEEAADRLKAARQRAAQARSSLNAWHAREFFRSAAVLAAIGQGVTELDTLRRLADCPLSDEDLSLFVAQVAEEFTHAREELTARVAIMDRIAESLGVGRRGGWAAFRKAATGLPEIRWPRVWERVFDEIARERAEERAKEAAARRRQAGGPRSLAEAMRGANPLLTLPEPVLPSGPGDHGVTAARRYDELVAADERAQQQVEDYEAEFRRLRQAHDEVVRPDNRLRWAVGILIVFTAVGIALPAWLMSFGPPDLAQVRWVLWPFLAALAALVIYVTVYLVQLTRTKPAPVPDVEVEHMRVS